MPRSHLQAKLFRKSHARHVREYERDIEPVTAT